MGCISRILFCFDSIGRCKLSRLFSRQCKTLMSKFLACQTFYIDIHKIWITKCYTSVSKSQFHRLCQCMDTGCCIMSHRTNIIVFQNVQHFNQCTASARRCKCGNLISPICCFHWFAEFGFITLHVRNIKTTTTIINQIYNLFCNFSFIEIINSLFRNILQKISNLLVLLDLTESIETPIFLQIQFSKCF